MWSGRMTKIAKVLALVMLPLAATAQDAPMDCEAMWAAMVPEASGYVLSKAGGGLVDGWCVLDAASLRAKAADKPNITVGTLRMRGDVSAGAFAGLEVEATGLRVTPKLGDRKMDARLQSLLRLLVADVSFKLRWNAEAQLMELREGLLVVPGRAEVTLGADITGVDPAAGAAGWLGGALTSLDLRVKSDGSLARPVMEAAGERLLPDGAERFEAVTAAKDALGTLVTALPDAAFPDGKSGLEALVAALPQAAGEMVLTLRSEAGMSAVWLALAGLKDDPFSARALEAVLRGIVVTVAWTPGTYP